MEFKKYKPSDSLKQYVAYFWTLKLSHTDAKDSVFRFVPDGYVDWIFHLKTPWQCNFPSQENSRTKSFHVFGQIKNYVDIHIKNNELELFGIKFFPSVASNIWNVDMHYLTDTCLPLEDLELKKIKALQERVVNSSSTIERIGVLQNYLCEELSNITQKNSLQQVMSQLHQNEYHINIKQTKLSYRRLQQLYKRELGISPKLFQRTLRINCAIESLKQQKEASLTKIALAHKYYDQSHFISDFKQFTGFNPSQFLKSINPSGDILNLQVD